MNRLYREKFIFIFIFIFISGCAGTTPVVSKRETSRADLIADQQNGIVKDAMLGRAINDYIDLPAGYSLIDIRSKEELGLDSKRFKSVQGSNYIKISSIGEEPNGYGLYTYILSKNTNDDIEGRSKVDFIVKYILSNFLNHERATEKDKNKPITKKSENLNLFLIPSTETSYNYALSSSIVNGLEYFLLKTKVKNTFDKEGPFLIVTEQPIGQIRDQIYYIYMDFSEINKKSLREIMSIYINKITDSSNGNKPFNIREFFKIISLDSLLDLNDSIKLVKSAAASQESINAKTRKPIDINAMMETSELIHSSLNSIFENLE